MLLKGITSKNNDDSYCLNCLRSFRTESKLKSLEKIWKNKDLCGIALPSQNIIYKNLINIWNQIKQCIIHADLESLIKKVEHCKNNPEKSSAKKLCEHILCNYSTSAIWAFDNTENKHSLYRGDVCMKVFCSSLREQAGNVISFFKKENVTAN